MSLEKRRVYQVAKEQKLSSDALISMLKGMDFEVKSHMSVVTDEMMEAITRKIDEEKLDRRSKTSERERAEPQKGRKRGDFGGKSGHRGEEGQTQEEASFWNPEWRERRGGDFLPTEFTPSRERVRRRSA